MSEDKETETIEVDGAVIKEIKQFCCLGNMLESEDGVENTGSNNMEEVER